MKKRRNLWAIGRVWTWQVLVCAVLTGCSAPGRVVLPTHPKQLSYPPLVFQPHKPRRVELDDGMKVLLMEDHDLPLVHIRAIIRAGNIYEPAGKSGLASLTGSVLRTGGTSSMTGDEIDQELELLAASIESGIGREMGKVTLSCLSRDLDRCLEIFADILRHPVFAEDKIQIEKDRLEEGIRRENDLPDRIARREFSYAVYGRDSVWARRPTLETVEAVTRDDLTAHHARYYHPGNILIGASGDFDSQDFIAKLDGVFSGWERAEIEFPSVPAVDQDIRPRVVLVPKDIGQTNILLGHLGYNRFDPNRYAIEVMNFIYGSGGFTSRLMGRVRTELGLAYVIWGQVGRDSDLGLYRVFCQTKAESTLQAVREIIRLTREMREEPPSEEEMARAIDSITNRFVFLYESPAQVVDQYLELEFYGYPEDFLDRYIGRIRAVTAGDVVRAARDYMRPDQLVILAVGNAGDFDGDPAEFGELETVDLDDGK